MAGKARKADHGAPRLEWASAVLGALIALVLIGLVLWQAIDARDEPLPRLTVEVERVQPAGELFMLDLKLSNASAQSAATVQVEANLAGEVEAAGSATIDYVPGKSTAKGGILIDQDPRGRGLEVKVIGFEIP